MILGLISGQFQALLQVSLRMPWFTHTLDWYGPKPCRLGVPRCECVWSFLSMCWPCGELVNPPGCVSYWRWDNHDDRSINQSVCSFLDSVLMVLSSVNERSHSQRRDCTSCTLICWNYTQLCGRGRRHTDNKSRRVSDASHAPLLWRCCCYGYRLCYWMASLYLIKFLWVLPVPALTTSWV